MVAGITDSLGDLATDVASIGTAVIAVVLVFAAFKWARRVIG
jgi:hypothetical protein